MLSALGIISTSGKGQKPGWYYLSIDDDFSRYYAWFFRLCGGWDLPLNGCHMTFIAGEKEETGIIPEMPYLGEEVQFFFEPQIKTDGRSFWVDSTSPRLDEIRSSMGLPIKWRGYHVTLGNLKNRKSIR